MGFRKLKQDQVRAISGGLFLIVHAPAYVCVCASTCACVCNNWEHRRAVPLPSEYPQPCYSVPWPYFLWCPVPSSLRILFFLIITRALGARSMLESLGNSTPDLVHLHRLLQEASPTSSPVPQIPGALKWCTNKALQAGPGAEFSLAGQNYIISGLGCGARVQVYVYFCMSLGKSVSKTPES